MGGRPTVLWALALSQSDAKQRDEMEQVAWDDSLPHEDRVRRVRQWYEQANVFETARELVDKYQSRAEEVADGIEPDELRRLFYYLIDSILERPCESTHVAMPLVDLESQLAADSVS